MLNRLQHAIQLWAKGRILFALFALVFIILFVLDFTDVPFGVRALAAQSGGLPILDLRSGYTPDDAYALFNALGAPGRQSYMTMLVAADILLPIVYALALATTIAWLLQRIVACDHVAQRLSLIPIFAFVGDWGENICFLTMMSFYPTRLNGVAHIANWLTMFKGVGLAISALVILVLLFALAWRGKSRSN